MGFEQRNECLDAHDCFLRSYRSVDRAPGRPGSRATPGLIEIRTALICSPCGQHFAHTRYLEEDRRTSVRGTKAGTPQGPINGCWMILVPIFTNSEIDEL
jgi:hypothetical protein